MAINNYTDLQTALTNWSQRSDLASRHPEFIQLAEAKFNRGFVEGGAFFPRQMEATTTLSAASTVSLPADFLEIRAVKLATSPIVKLQQATSDWFDTTRNSTATAKPSYFNIEANKLRLMPSPDSAYSVSFTYVQQIPPLASNSTNWLLTLAPDVYLYGALVELSGFIDNDNRVPLWKAGYDRAVNAMKLADVRARYSGGGLVVRSA